MIEEYQVGTVRAMAWALDAEVGDAISKLMLLALAAASGTNVVALSRKVIDRTEIEQDEMSALTALLDLQDKGFVRLHVELVLPGPVD